MEAASRRPEQGVADQKIGGRTDQRYQSTEKRRKGNRNKQLSPRNGGDIGNAQRHWQRDSIGADIVHEDGHEAGECGSAGDDGEVGGSCGRETGGETLNAASEKITALASQTKQTLNSTYGQNPLLIAGIGLVVGAFVASALPSTRVEGRVFGDTSERLRRRAADAAAQGLDTAKELANNVVEAAADEGLSAEGLAAAADGITKKVRTVAERGLKTALGDETPAQQKAYEETSWQTNRSDPAAPVRISPEKPVSSDKI